MTLETKDFAPLESSHDAQFTSEDAFDGTKIEIDRRTLLTGGFAALAVALSNALGIDKVLAKEPTSEQIATAADILERGYLSLPWVGAEIKEMQQSGATEKRILLQDNLGMTIKLLSNEQVKIGVCSQEPDGTRRWHCVSKVVPVSSIPTSTNKK